MAKTFRMFLPGKVADRLQVVPHGLRDLVRSESNPPLAQGQQSSWCFVGRLSAEKGLDRLLEEWPEGEELIVIGDGPVRQELESRSTPGVHFLGHVPISDAIQKVRQSQGLIFSSLCIEGQPSVLPEALMCGTPILAREGSSGADIARSVDPDWVFSDRWSLKAAQESIRAQGADARGKARRAYLEEYTERIWLERIENTYQEAISNV
jgi:glycosyltransferase involved in cell wall biosynthesis